MCIIKICAGLIETYSLGTFELCNAMKRAEYNQRVHVRTSYIKTYTLPTMNVTLVTSTNEKYIQIGGDSKTRANLRLDPFLLSVQLH